MNQTDLLTYTAYALIPVLLFVFWSIFKNSEKLESEQKNVSTRSRWIRIAIFFFVAAALIYANKTKLISETVEMVLFVASAIFISQIGTKPPSK